MAGESQTFYLHMVGCARAHNLLRRAATPFMNEMEEINRVVYDLTSKLPETIE